MLLFWPGYAGSLLLLYHILMLWRWKVNKSLLFLDSGIPVLDSLIIYPPHPSSGCSWLSHTAPYIKWREPSHPQHEQAMFILIPTEQILSLSLHCLLEGFAQKSWILCANIMSLSLGTLGEILGNTFKKTCFSSGQGSDVEVMAAATVLQTAIVIYTACTETVRR